MGERIGQKSFVLFGIIKAAPMLFANHGRQVFLRRGPFD